MYSVDTFLFELANRMASATCKQLTTSWSPCGRWPFINFRITPTPSFRTSSYEFDASPNAANASEAAELLLWSMRRWWISERAVRRCLKILCLSLACISATSGHERRSGRISAGACSPKYGIWEVFSRGRSWSSARFSVRYLSSLIASINWRAARSAFISIQYQYKAVLILILNSSSILKRY